MFTDVLGMELVALYERHPAD